MHERFRFGFLEVRAVCFRAVFLAACSVISFGPVLVASALAMLRRERNDHVVTITSKSAHLTIRGNEFTEVAMFRRESHHCSRTGLHTSQHKPTKQLTFPVLGMT